MYRILGESMPGKRLQYFYNLIWVFMLGSFFGYCLETVWFLIRDGRYKCRQGVIYGPFSQIYGFGFVVVLVCLWGLRKRGILMLYLVSCLMGGIFEYASSVFQEKILGIISWDYSHFRYNVDGRINLQFSLLWGVVGVISIRYVYPWLYEQSRKIPRKAYAALSWVFFWFMIFDLSVSVGAQHRQLARSQGVVATNVVQKFMDQHYTDERLNKIYTSVKKIPQSPGD